MTNLILRPPPTDLGRPQSRSVADRRREAVGAYLASLNTQVSRDTMRFSLERIVSAMGSSEPIESFPWEAFDANRIEGLRSAMRTAPGIELAASSINKHVSALRGVLRRCRRLRLIDADTWADIADMKPLPAHRLPRGRMVTQAERSKLVAACDNTKAGIRDRAILMTMIGCGCRRAEVAMLPLAGYDLGQHTITVLGKGNKPRIIPIVPAVGAALERWILIRGRVPGPMFFRITKADRVTDQPFAGATVLQILERRRIAAGLASMSPHDFRRTLISELFDAGVDIATIRLIAGHAKGDTTMGYDRRPFARAAEALGKVWMP